MRNLQDSHYSKKPSCFVRKQISLNILSSHHSFILLIKELKNKAYHKDRNDLPYLEENRSSLPPQSKLRWTVCLTLYPVVLLAEFCVGHGSVAQLILGWALLPCLGSSCDTRQQLISLVLSAGPWRLVGRGSWFPLRVQDDSDIPALR